MSGSQRQADQVCPKCNVAFEVREFNTGTLLVVSGQYWHRPCFMESGAVEFLSPRSRSFLEHSEACTICSKPISANEKLVVGGKIHHRQCYNQSEGSAKANSLSPQERCAQCGRGIQGDHIVVNKDIYHKHCWVASGREKLSPRTLASNHNVVVTPPAAVEICPVCNNTVSGEIIIISGKTQHKQCYESTKKLTSPKAVEGTSVTSADVCPLCKKEVTGGEKLIVSGQTHHRSCYEATGKLSSPRTASISSNSPEKCTICQGNVPLADKIIVSGAVYHRRCHSSTEIKSVTSPRNDVTQGGCAICHNPINFVDKVIFKGADHHRSCLENAGLLSPRQTTV